MGGAGAHVVASALAISLVSLLAGCGGGGNEGNANNANNSPAESGASTPTAGKVAGIVVASDSGLPLAGVKAQVTEAVALSAADGSFTLENVIASNRPVVRLSREGYADTYVMALMTSGKLANVVARMAPVAASTKFENATGATLIAANGVARVVVPANGVVDAATGKAPQGAVSMQIGVIDPASNSANMPGSYLTNDAASLESFGAMSIQMRDAAGNKLTMAKGSTAAVRIPLSSRSSAPPQTIALLYLDEASGRWVEEGAAKLTGVAPQQFYEGNVVRAATWNVDRKMEVVFVKGCVVDADGKSLADVIVNGSGIDYSNAGAAVTNASGQFTIGVRKGGRASIAAAYSRSSAVTVIEPSQVDVTLPNCIVASTKILLPVFIVKPTNLAAFANTPLEIPALVGSEDAVAYQWFRNGQPISGATQSRLRFAAVTLADDQAKFTVRVTSSVGSVTSDPATLTVLSTPPVDALINLVDQIYILEYSYLVALEPLGKFIQDDGKRWRNPGTICRTGTASGTVNGQPIPAGSAVVSGNFDLIGVFNNCASIEDGRDVDSGTITANVTAASDLNKFSWVTKASNFSINANQGTENFVSRTFTGAVAATLERLKTPSGETIISSAKPDAGTTLRDNVKGQTTQFITGNTLRTTLYDSRDEQTQSSIVHGNNRFSVDGVIYETSGALTIIKTPRGGYGSGQLSLARNGYQIGRIFADDAGLYYDTNGTITTMGSK